MSAAQISHRVNVFHSELKHSHELALALQKAKILNYYITSIDRRKNASSHPSFAELETSSVVRYLWPKVIRSTLGHSWFPDYLKQPITSFANQAMDGHVSRHYLKDIDAIIGFEGSSVKTFREAKKSGIKCVLDQPTWLATHARKILSEEAALHPDFAETIDQGFENWARHHDRLEEACLADLILCGSYLVKQSFEHEKMESAKIQIVPYGVNAEEFLCPRGGESFFKNNVIRVLFVGSIGQRKGIKYLLEAIKQIGNKKIELTLIGDFYGPRTAYKPYAGWFRHIPRAPRHFMRHYYAAADLLILPAIAEGFGLPVLEAMASGIPAIVSENTGAKDVIEDGKEGFVIPIRNIKALKEKILYFYESPVKVLEMGERARKKAEHFSWFYYQGNIKSIFDRFLGKQR